MRCSSNKVQEYERMVGQPVQTRYNKVKNMARTYIKEGSNFEINIESSMRDGVLKVSVPAAPVPSYLHMPSAHVRKRRCVVSTVANGATYMSRWRRRLFLSRSHANVLSGTPLLVCT